jgi:hypothetical protein
MWPIVLEIKRHARFNGGSTKGHRKEDVIAPKIHMMDFVKRPNM